MPNVLLLNLNDLPRTLIATALVKRFVRDGYNVHCVSDAESMPIFEFSGARTSDISEGYKLGAYDVAINISPSFLCCELINRTRANKKLGYGVAYDGIDFYNEGAKILYETQMLHKESKSNQFQLTFGLADITWQGEGYALGYFPRNRTRKNLTGLATKDTRLKEFLSRNLGLERSRLWHIPFKKNILKHIDETNRCKQVVTDDQVTLHVALALRKNVEFLTPHELPYKVEMFGSGNIHVYDPDSIKNFIQEPNAS